MLNFNTFAPSSINSINAESNFFWRFQKNKSCNLFFLEFSILFFQNSLPLKSLGTVESANFFQRILSSLCVFQEYDKSVHQSREYADGSRTESISVNCRSKPNRTSILNHLPIQNRMGKNHLTLLSL